jgi:hypothetical protein
VPTVRLSEGETSHYRQATPRGKYWSEAMFWVELDEATSAQRQYHNYLIEHRLFMTSELSDMFSAVDKDLAESLIEYESCKEFPDPDVKKSYREKLTKLPGKIELIEAAVQKRLRCDEA